MELVSYDRISAGRIFNSEIVVQSADTFCLIVKIKEMSHLGFGRLSNH